MKSILLAAALMGALPAVASAGHRDGFAFSFGLGDVGFGYSRYSHRDFHDGYRGYRGGDRVSVGFGYSYSEAPVYSYSQPVYVEPAPVVCAPAPTYYAPPAVVYAPAPVYSPPVVVYSPPVYYRPYYDSYYQPSSYSYVRYYSR